MLYTCFFIYQISNLLYFHRDLDESTRGCFFQATKILKVLSEFCSGKVIPALSQCRLRK